MSVPIASPPGRGSRVWALALRVIFTLIPPVSLGVLAWVPLLRLALLRRRRVDWALFALVFALSFTSTFILGLGNGKAGPYSTAAALVLLVVAFGAAAYFPIADRGGRAGEAALQAAGRSTVPQFPGYPPAYPAAYGPPIAPPTAAPAHQAPHPVFPPLSPPPAPSPPQPPERIKQVRDELGEISEYLHNKDVW